MRIALVGCGRWGRLILRDLKSLGCWVVAAARSEQSILNAREGGADQVVQSIEALPRVDGIVLANASIEHGRALLELVKLGLPIFCEKPMTCDVDEARRVVELASDRVFVMHKWRYHPGIEALRDVGRSGELGPVLGLKTVRFQWGYSHTDVDPTWILLPHDLSIALEILGSLPVPERAVSESDDDGPFSLNGWLSGAAWHHCEINTRSTIYDRRVELRCRNGIAVMADPYASHIEVLRTDNGARRRAMPVPERRAYIDRMPLLVELEVFVNYLKGEGAPPKDSAKDGLQIVEAITQLRRLAGIVD